MLKEYQIENFKAFAGPVNIPIKPITLIFGANSSGKSSIFQSLLMLKQTLQEGKDSNISLLPRGNIVDLGSFREFIHNHDVTRSFSFKMTFSTPKEISQYSGIDWPFNDIHPNVKTLEKSIGSETIGLRVTFSLDSKSLNIVVSKIDLFIGDNPTPIITYKIGEKNERGSNIYNFKGNFDHEYWHTYWEYFDEEDSEGLEKIYSNSEKNLTNDLKALKEKLDGMSDSEREIFISQFKEKIEIDKEKNGKSREEPKKLTGSERALEIYKSLFVNDQLSLQAFLPDLLNGDDLQHLVWCTLEAEESRDVSLFALTAANLIKKLLKDVEYIAPLREYPERFYIYGGNPLESVGSSGKMVFDVLFNNPELLDKVNDEFKRFGTDYELRLSPYMKDKSETSEVFVPELFNKSTGVAASFRDVGFGFSQVLPVIVQSMLSKEKTLLIEQPELHLHPALQAELGDVFIESALGKNKNTFLIETHSEHLILRLLRRIRETTEGELEEGDNPLRPEDVAVVYARPTEKGTELIELRITEDGDFADKWPDGFFAERAKELF